MALNRWRTQGLFHETIKVNHSWLLQIPKPVGSKLPFCLWLHMTREKHITLAVLHLQNIEIGQMSVGRININAHGHSELSKLQLFYILLTRCF